MRIKHNPDSGIRLCYAFRFPAIPLLTWYTERWLMWPDPCQAPKARSTDFVHVQAHYRIACLPANVGGKAPNKARRGMKRASSMREDLLRSEVMG
jgi:hypothetical protein